MRQEKNLRENYRPTFEFVRNQLFWELTFPEPVFHSTDARLDRADFIEAGHHYILLLNILKKAARNRDQLLRLIGQWLRDEGISAPHRVLPTDVFRRLTKQGRERVKGISLTDRLYADFVKTSLPYTGALLADAKILRGENKDPVKDLPRLGYSDVAARRAGKRWRSPVEFTCDWLAYREGLPLARPRRDPTPSRTLINAYSRVYGSRRRSRQPRP